MHTFLQTWLWNEVDVFRTLPDLRAQVVVWSGQADLSDLLLSPEEVVTVVTRASVGGLGARWPSPRGCSQRKVSTGPHSGETGAAQRPV